MRGHIYPAAQAVSPKVRAHFARHLAEARLRGQERVASLPDTDAIEAIIDAAFWASLRREEGYVPRISLAFLSPEEAGHPLVFERPLPLGPSALTRVAPAVERAGIHLDSCARARRSPARRSGGHRGVAGVDRAAGQIRGVAPIR